MDEGLIDFYAYKTNTEPITYKVIEKVHHGYVVLLTTKETIDRSRLMELVGTPVIGHEDDIIQGVESFCMRWQIPGAKLGFLTRRKDDDK